MSSGFAHISIKILNPFLVVVILNLWSESSSNYKGNDNSYWSYIFTTKSVSMLSKQYKHFSDYYIKFQK